MKLALLFFVLGLVCLCTSSPANPDDNAIEVQTRPGDIVGNTRKLIEQLLQNLQVSAQKAMESIGTFTQGLQNQASLFAEKLVNDLKALRDRITEAINKVTDRFSGAGAAVRLCIEARRQEADALFSEAATRARSCADGRIKEVNEMVQNLSTLSKDALEFSNGAIEDLKKCTQLNDGNILATGACLGSVALQTEMKGAVFLTQSGLAISRINLAIATLPAALDVCAGAQLLSAGIGTARLVMEIGSCSASSVFSTFTGNALDS